MDDLFQSTDRLAQFPESGRVVPELRAPEYREIIFRKAYRVVYRIETSRVSILTVRNFAQRLDESELKAGP